MKKWSKFLLILIFLFSISACKPKINASNLTTLRESIEKVRNPLEGDKKEEFEKYLSLIMDDYIGIQLIAAKLAGFDIPPDLKAVLDNKTADEVIEQGKIIEEENAKKEIDRLYNVKAKYDESKLEIDKFKVTNAKFERHSYYFIDDEVISFTITNNTNHPVSRIYFDVELISKNRSTPWNSTSGNYSIPGGIEVGESKALDLSLGIFDYKWDRNVNPPKDAILKIKITKLDNSERNTLYSIEDFTIDDSHLLDSLLNKFPKFKK